MKIELENNEVQYLLNILAERPYRECAATIEKIAKQVQNETRKPVTNGTFALNPDGTKGGANNGDPVE